MRDTTIVVPPDSAWLHALLECDSAGNVLLRELETTRGRNAALAAVNLVKSDESRAFELRAVFVVDSLLQEILLRDKEIMRQTSATITKVVEVKMPRTWIEKTLIAFGGFFLLLLLIAFATMVLMLFRK